MAKTIDGLTTVAALPSGAGQAAHLTPEVGKQPPKRFMLELDYAKVEMAETVGGVGYMKWDDWRKIEIGYIEDIRFVEGEVRREPRQRGGCRPRDGKNFMHGINYGGREMTKVWVDELADNQTIPESTPTLKIGDIVRVVEAKGKSWSGHSWPVGTYARVDSLHAGYCGLGLVVCAEENAPSCQTLHFHEFEKI